MKKQLQARGILVIALSAVLAFGMVRADQHGPVQWAAGDAEIIRDGNTIRYRWRQGIPLGDTVTMEFEITFHHGTANMRNTYRSLNHDHGDYYHRFVAGDPFRYYLFVLARELRLLANFYGMNEAELALSFVQALPYQVMGYYQRYAVETLLDGRGDCSCTSVLFAGILSAWRYGAVFIELPSHLAVGVRCDYSCRGTYWNWYGRRFYYCETTSRGWKIGECSEKYQHTSAALIPIGSIRY